MEHQQHQHQLDDCLQCDEGKVTFAKKDQKITFSKVNSCLTLTFLFEDGEKMAVHLTLEEEPPDGNVGYLTVYNSLKTKLQVLTKRVIKVWIIGALGCWNVNLRPAFVIPSPFEFFALANGEKRINEFYLPYWKRIGHVPQDFEYDQKDEERREEFAKRIIKNLELIHVEEIIFMAVDQTLTSGVEFCIGQCNSIIYNENELRIVQVVKVVA